jgi:hypothetical protein
MWSDSSRALVDAVAQSLRARVVADISQAYSSIGLKRACELLGMDAEALLAGVPGALTIVVAPQHVKQYLYTNVRADCENNHNWRVDRQSDLLRIRHELAGATEEVDLSELQHITEQMIALS